jgi:hypothetical protein
MGQAANSPAARPISEEFRDRAGSCVSRMNFFQVGDDDVNHVALRDMLPVALLSSFAPPSDRFCGGESFHCLCGSSCLFPRVLFLAQIPSHS